METVRASNAGVLDAIDDFWFSQIEVSLVRSLQGTLSRANAKWITAARFLRLDFDDTILL
jgi:hypothetical protein